jgi:DNA-cytosine methyltransferase
MSSTATLTRPGFPSPAFDPAPDQTGEKLFEIEDANEKTTSQPPAALWSRVLVIEDDSSRSVRRSGARARRDGQPLTTQIHRVEGADVEVLHSCSYLPTKLRGERVDRNSAIACLLEEVEAGAETLVVANSAYGSSKSFLAAVTKRGFKFAVELRPSTRLLLHEGEVELRSISAGEAVAQFPKTSWSDYQVTHGTTRRPFRFCAADAGAVTVSGIEGRLIVAHSGGVSTDVHRGTYLAFTNDLEAPINEILQVVGWSRWIREHARLQERTQRNAQGQLFPDEMADEGEFETPKPVTPLVIRSNLAVARRRDQNAAARTPSLPLETERKAALPAADLNVVELFAGAGGMGLGFLMARREHRRFRVVYSGELEPIYARTLQLNHETIEERHPGQGLVPRETTAADLTKEESLEQAEAAAAAAGGAHVLVGGPPCQGFSAANRNSWSTDNPNNQLVDVFLRYVERLQPRVFVMENVQGILWTSKAGRRQKVSVADDLHGRLEKAGYLVFRDLLDAAWYGVPQHRTRYFVIGIHRDLGYNYEDFGASGPFPKPTHGDSTDIPYLTVGDAIADLPVIENGHRVEEMIWTAPKKMNAFLRAMREEAEPKQILDHVTSTHAPYVLDRYRAIPEGGNWQDIQDLMTNYAAIERTHSNIYRRLRWDEPTITMGHYRKSMLIHPSQNRGLSLREAMRLQSFPDWVRFAGSEAGVKGGLMHKQQQLANAVCPLVLRAIAEQIAQL